MFRKKSQDEGLAPHEMGPPVEFRPQGGTDGENKANLLQARQSMGIVTAKEIFADALTKHTDRILLDYTRDSVSVRYDVDGFWHQMPPRDRQQGDMMLAVLKKISNLNINERRARQEGCFGTSYHDKQYNCTLTSQGTPTGERAIIRIDPKKPRFSTLSDLGMRDKMLEDFKRLVGRHIEGDDEPSVKSGLIVISAPPAGGLSTTWHFALATTDRYMRDFVCLEEKSAREPEVENVEVVTYDAAAGETPDKLLPRILLKQPEVLVVPEIPNPATLKILLEQVNTEGRMAITSVRAKDAPEALLRLLTTLKPPPQDYAQAVTCVLNARLVRRLCEKCKQPYQPHPQLLAKLGIPPGRVGALYREWQPPPPEQLPQKKKGEEPFICPNCNGLGYRGRIALFELMELNDAIREALVKRPDVNVVRRLSRQAGNRTLQEEGILAVARGITSLTELQRVMKQQS